MSCAAPGSVRCWGDNDHGQLGNGTTVDSTLPVDPLGLVDVQQVSAGGDSTCALLGDDTVRCWGAGAGTGGVDDPTPVAVNGLGDVTQLTSGLGHHCALLGDGSVRCWGGNQFGQLGNGTTVDSYLPVSVVGTLPPAVQVSAGSEHTCALDAAGEVSVLGLQRLRAAGPGQPEPAAAHHAVPRHPHPCRHGDRRRRREHVRPRRRRFGVVLG